MDDALRKAATHARRLANGSNLDAYRDALADLGRAYLAAYPTAAHAQQPAPVALSQDAILDMAEGCTLQFHDLLAFARKVERAHGIPAATPAPATDTGEQQR